MASIDARIGREKYAKCDSTINTSIIKTVWQKNEEPLSCIGVASQEVHRSVQKTGPGAVKYATSGGLMYTTLRSLPPKVRLEHTQDRFLMCNPLHSEHPSKGVPMYRGQTGEGGPKSKPMEPEKVLPQ